MGPKFPIFLKDVQESDMDLLWRWANDISVRNNSFNSFFIKYEEHKKWFLKGLKDKNRIMLIALDSNNCKLGQIRFDLDKSKRTAIIDISIDPASRSFGIANTTIKLGLKRMREEWGENVIAEAKILKSNQTSINCFTKAGFSREDDNLNENSNFLVFKNI